MLYFTVTRLDHTRIQLIHQLRLSVSSIQSTLIRDSNVLSQVHATKLIRLSQTESFELLAIHEEVTNGHYEFILTLLLKQLSGEQIIVQIREPRRLFNIIIGLHNRLTNTTLYPCVLFDLSNFDSTLTTLLQCFINSLLWENYQIL